MRDRGSFINTLSCKEPEARVALGGAGHMRANARDRAARAIAYEQLMFRIIVN